MKKSRFLWILAVGLLTIPIIISSARGAVFHVRNGTALQEALIVCETNGEDDAIFLASGVYKLSGPFGELIFHYQPGEDGDFRSLTLRGEPGTSTGNVVVKHLVIYHPNSATLAVRPVIEVAGITFEKAEIYADPYDIIVRNSVFRNGRSANGSGGGLAIYCGFGKVTLENNRIFNNEVSAPYGYGRCEGGGLHIWQPSELVMINNVIAYNRATNCPDVTSRGGGAYIVTACLGGDPSSACVPKAYLVGNTVFGNEADEGAGIFNHVFCDNLLYYYNNIIFGNTASLPEGSDLYFYGVTLASEINGFNNDYSGFSGEWTTSAGNVDVDPSFVSPSTNDFHLQSTSPVIDSGTSGVPDPSGLPLTDAEGAPRLSGPAPDMGAYEYEDRSGTSAPLPDIQVNGSDGPLTLARSDTITISLSLANNGWTNPVDWWLVMGTSAGIFSLTPFNWKEGLMPFYQGRLYNLPTFSFPPITLTGLPAGQYNLVFGIDMNADGEVTWDSVYYDFVTLNVIP